MTELVIRCGRHSFNLKSITVEPVIFMYMFSLFLQFITTQALIYDKVCASNFNATVCANLENKTFKDEEEFIQKKTSHWLMYSNICMGLPALLTVVLLLGPVGDQYGRKMPMICSLVGGVGAALVTMLNAIYMDAALAYMLIGSLINGISGGYIAALMSMYAYIALASSPEYRTIKIGILEATIFLAGTLGTGLSGVMLDKTSYTFVFGLLTGILSLSLLYTLIWVDNIKPQTSSDAEAKDRKENIVCKTLKSVALCVYYGRKNKNFVNLILLTAILFFAMVVTVGENDIILIYTRHPPLAWGQTKLGLFKGTESFLRGISVLVLLPIFKKILHARDSTVIICGLLSKICEFLFLGIGRNTAMMFTGAVTGVMQGFAPAAARSQCASMVEADEQAKMFSLIALFEAIAGLIATTLFNNVYNATLTFFHGFCFILMAGILGIGTALAIFLHYRLDKDPAGTDYGLMPEEIEDEVIVAPGDGSHAHNQHEEA